MSVDLHVKHPISLLITKQSISLRNTENFRLKKQQKERQQGRCTQLHKWMCRRHSLLVWLREAQKIHSSPSPPPATAILEDLEEQMDHV